MMDNKTERKNHLKENLDSACQICGDYVHEGTGCVAISIEELPDNLPMGISVEVPEKNLKYDYIHESCATAARATQDYVDKISPEGEDFPYGWASDQISDIIRVRLEKGDLPDVLTPEDYESAFHLIPPIDEFEPESN